MKNHLSTVLCPLVIGAVFLTRIQLRSITGFRWSGGGWSQYLATALIPTSAHIVEASQDAAFPKTR